MIIQDNAGFGAGFENDDYDKVGAKIAPSAGDIFNDSDMNSTFSDLFMYRTVSDN